MAVKDVCDGIFADFEIVGDPAIAFLTCAGPFSLHVADSIPQENEDACAN